MIAHYLSTAVRHFRRHRFTTAINVACLALGLTCFVLAWGMAEFYDQGDYYQPRAARTQFLTVRDLRPGDVVPTITVTPWVLGERLKADFRELEAVARVYAPPMQDPTPVTVDGTHGFAVTAFAEKELLRIFDLPFVVGDAKTALDAPASIIVSRTLARRLFGTDDVLGRTLRLNDHRTVTVTGVVDSIRAPSHLSTTRQSINIYFEALVSMDVYLRDVAELPNGGDVRLTRWRNNNFLTYVLLPADGSLTAQQLNASFAEFARRNVPALDGQLRFTAQPIGRFWETQLNVIAGSDRTGVSSMTLLRALGTLVLLIACLNYANLATAQAVTRAREVALQRIVGAGRCQVLLQSLFESALLTSVALLLALGLIGASVGALGGLSSDVTRMFLSMPALWVGLVVLIAAVSLVASFYPALVVASVRPADALRQAKARSGPRFFATLLVGMQFAAASLLLITVFVMHGQQQGLHDAVLAQTTDPVVIIANNLKSSGIDSDLLRAELGRGPGVLVASGVARVPWSGGLTGVSVATSAQADATLIRGSLSIVAYDFFAALGIAEVAGRDFARDRGLDVADLSRWDALTPGSFAIRVDRSYARRLGFADPADAVGKRVYRPTSRGGESPPQQLTIIGVVEDSTHTPLTGGAQGNVYLLNPAAATVPVVRLESTQLRAGLGHIDSVWQRRAPSVPLVRHFADEQFDLSFRSLETLRSAFSVLAGFAALIASMGLVGMALHVTRRRVHEIGVRKTLGATVPQILLMLLGNFSKPVVIANIAIWPLVYVVMRGYLSMFAQSAGLTPTPFLLSLGATLLIAWAAVAVQATRAARAQPAHVLRYE